MSDDAHSTTQFIPTGSVWKDAIERFSSRKFVITVFVMAVGAWGFLHHLMEGGTYLAFSSMILAVYGGASIVDKKFNGPS